MEKQDLISRTEALEALKGVIARTGAYGVSVEVILEALPSVEAEPVAHARWDIRVNPGYYDTYGRPDKNAHCTHCGFIWTDLYSVNHYFKYCPNCGAKMDEEAADEA